MKFYMAYEMAQRPFLIFQTVAKNVAEAQAKNLIDHPLVLPEEQLPIQQYGVCPLEIVNGQLVERAAPEMAEHEAYYLKYKKVAAQNLKTRNIDLEVFSFGGVDYPMNQTARLHYSAIAHLGGTQKIMDSSGTDRTIDGADIAAFMTAYFTKLKSIATGVE